MTEITPLTLEICEGCFAAVLADKLLGHQMICPGRAKAAPSFHEYARAAAGGEIALPLPQAEPKRFTVTEARSRKPLKTHG